PPNLRSGFVQKAKRFLPCASRRDVRTVCLVLIVTRHFAVWSWCLPTVIQLVPPKRSLLHCDFTTRPWSLGKRLPAVRLITPICYYRAAKFCALPSRKWFLPRVVPCFPRG